MVVLLNLVFLLKWGFIAVEASIIQKLAWLSTFGRSDCINNISLNIKDLIPAGDGQYFPLKGGHIYRLFHFYMITDNQCVKIRLLYSVMTLDQNSSCSRSDGTTKSRSL